jgi:hypothetical protein
MQVIDIECIGAGSELTLVELFGRSKSRNSSGSRALEQQATISPFGAFSARYAGIWGHDEHGSGPERENESTSPVITRSTTGRSAVDAVFGRNLARDAARFPRNSAPKRRQRKGRVPPSFLPGASISRTRGREENKSMQKQFTLHGGSVRK